MSYQQTKTVPLPALELDDIQGNILRPYAMDFARYVFLTFTEPAAARTWIRKLSGCITTAAPWKNGKPPFALNLGLSHQGLRALELPASTLESFPAEFQAGMSGRSVVLGDVGRNAPSRWDPTFQKPTSLHAILMIHARTEADREEAQRQALSLAGADKLALLGAQDAQRIPGPNGTSLEHFGYADGIGQPSIEGTPKEDQLPGQGTWVPAKDGQPGRWEPLNPGSFVLGYPDVFGQMSIFPSDPEVRKNGTYLVIRKLQQDVRKYREYLSANAATFGWTPEQLGAKIMGRWRDGTPVALSPDRPDPAIARDPSKNNDFLYGDDPDGARCPMGAHLRRANPRDSKFAEYVPAHRIIRRGIPYGRPLADDAAQDNEQRGLMFLAYNTSLGQQFELIQQQWMDNGNASQGLASVTDPISHGGKLPSVLTCPVQHNQFTAPSQEAAIGRGGETVRFATKTVMGMPGFIEVKGGEYFFVPGINALHAISEPKAAPQPEPKPQSFLALYDACETIVDPTERTRGQSALLKKYIFLAQKQDPAIWKELRETRPIMVTPMGVLVSTYADTVEVLGRADVFSVSGYNERMTATTGPFFLGMDDSGSYDAESSIARLVVRRDDLPRIRRMTGKITEILLQQVKDLGKNVDVTNLTGLALLRVIGHYYGVAGPNDITMSSWFANISSYIFAPVPPPVAPGKKDPFQLGTELRAYLDGLIDTRKSQIARGEVCPDDVLQRLLQLRDCQGEPLDHSLVRCELAGLVSGTLVATASVLTTAVRYFVSKEGLSEGYKQKLLEAVQMGDEKLVGSYVLEAARLDPTPAMLYRITSQDYTLRGVQIPQGTMVVCGLGSAMRDGAKIKNPETFWPNRPDYEYLNFGFGMHACLGRHLGMGIMTSIVMMLMKIDGAAIVSGQMGYPPPPPPDGEGHQVSDSSDSLVLSYAGKDGAANVPAPKAKA
jgi:Dyp-type peroxidase family